MKLKYKYCFTLKYTNELSLLKNKYVKYYIKYVTQYTIFKIYYLKIECDKNKYLKKAPLKCAL